MSTGGFGCTTTGSLPWTKTPRQQLQPRRAGMNGKEREDPQPDHGKGPPVGKGRPVDHGRPVPHHGSAATTSAPAMKGK
jgi:hypothetical protein